MGGRSASFANTNSNGQPLNLTEEVFRENREGFVFSKTNLGELYVGYKGTYDTGALFAKDTPENRERLNQYWETNSFSREIKRRK